MPKNYPEPTFGYSNRHLYRSLPFDVLLLFPFDPMLYSASTHHYRNACDGRDLNRSARISSLAQSEKK